MSTKQTAYEALLSVIKEFDLAPSTVGREIANDPGFMARMKDTNKSISTTTLDSVFRFILKQRGQLDLDLD